MEPEDIQDIENLLGRYPTPWNCFVHPSRRLRGFRALECAKQHMMSLYHTTSGRFITRDAAMDWCRYDPDSIRLFDDDGGCQLSISLDLSEDLGLRDLPDA